MVESKEFLKLILDSISEHIVVINELGDIIFVNRSWQTFGQDNNCSCDVQWRQQNYLAICESAAKQGDEFGIKALAGLQKVINNQQQEYYLEYPCHSDTESRWFLMRAVPLEYQSQRYVVISHLNITERMRAEQQLKMLAHIDGLTQLANRRHFDNFFEQEWSRCLRLKQPISIAMIDLDHFKLLNDNFGHLVGDICLKSLANLLTQFARRPSDLCARYGGEEFVLVLGNTHSEQAYQLLSRFMTQLTELHIEELHNQQLTVSIGLATLVPGFLDIATTLIDMADKALYQAKETGRNKLVVAQTQTDIVSKMPLTRGIE